MKEISNKSKSLGPFALFGFGVSFQSFNIFNRQSSAESLENCGHGHNAIY